MNIKEIPQTNNNSNWILQQMKKANAKIIQYRDPKGVVPSNLQWKVKINVMMISTLIMGKACCEFYRYKSIESNDLEKIKKVANISKVLSISFLASVAMFGYNIWREIVKQRLILDQLQHGKIMAKIQKSAEQKQYK